MTMRYRIMATYQGAPYEAGIGPSGADVVLFAACPPPEELGFEPATGHWRKELGLGDVQALWESRPVGTFLGEPCLVLDDLGDRLHIAYRGHDAYQAERLGYWQVDRGVFELVTPRENVTNVVEERVDYSHQAVSSRSGPAASDGRQLPPGSAMPDPIVPPTSEPPLPVEAAARAAAAAARSVSQPAWEQQPSRRRGRSGRRPVATQQMFSELASLAGIPPAAFALGEVVDGAMCLLHTAEGYEVFSAAGGARHETRQFDDEESAYFYLFGVLVAEAVRTGHLVARPDLVSTAPSRE